MTGIDKILYYNTILGNLYLAGFRTVGECVDVCPSLKKFS